VEDASTIFTVDLYSDKDPPPGGDYSAAARGSSYLVRQLVCPHTHTHTHGAVGSKQQSVAMFRSTVATIYCPASRKRLVRAFRRTLFLSRVPATLSRASVGRGDIDARVLSVCLSLTLSYSV